jgi:hypothetical protein
LALENVFSRPAVASSFDFSKSNFEVLELTARPLELTGIAVTSKVAGGIPLEMHTAMT